MISKLFRIATSMQTMAILLLFFAGSIGYATFIENDFGRASAKALIYNTWWFELILLLLAINLFNNLFKYNLFRRTKLAVLIFHLAFIVIIIGAAITRYFSFEGMMHIREGEATNLFVSDDTYLQFHVNDLKHQYEYDKKLFLSGITSNNFDIRIPFKEHDIAIEYVQFLPNVKDSIFENIKDGQTMLHLVVPGENGMQNEFLADKQQKTFSFNTVSLNNYQADAINIRTDSGKLICNSYHSVSTMSMDTRKTTTIDSLTDFTLEKRTLYTINNLNFVLKDVLQNALEIPMSTSNKMKDGELDALKINLRVNNQHREVILYGGKGFVSQTTEFTFQGLNFKLSYGAKYFTAPFLVRLNDFQLERYAGSMSPSSFASEVSVIEGVNETNHSIYMNNVLDYKGYRLFQSSYDQDEKGTILSVNKDRSGTLVTYFGYLMLAIGFILVFFSQNTRYRKLGDKLKRLGSITAMLLVFVISASAQNRFDEQHIQNFETLVVQDHGGRFKPVHTVSSEYLRKICGKETWEDIPATEVLLSMMHDPATWSKKEWIKVTDKAIITLLHKEPSKNLRVAFNDFFDKEGKYLLSEQIELAYSKTAEERNQSDKEFIKLDEKVNICFTIFAGDVFRLFPLPNDSNNTWHTYLQSTAFTENDSLFVANVIPMYFMAVQQGLESDNWSTADTVISYIRMFQQKYAANVMPSKRKISVEIFYNKTKLFSNLFFFYFLFGIISLCFAIFNLFYSKQWLKNIYKLLHWTIIIGFVAHTIGLALRWYISGHAPWSNGYESIVYIAWATILAGILYSKKSSFTLSATAIISGLLLMVAHLNWLDPEITNLVPVLKSYWLMIHVAIITASYGFLSLGAILGLIVLWLIILSNAKNISKIKCTLEELTIINEKTLEAGLFLLTTGTFLGAIWANESWGRYWGWDAKETWALVSILIYTFVLHMRFVPSLKGMLSFNTAALFAIWSIIMTYFGVNYYLSGLHSYAAGDPMPIPNFVYYLLGVMIFSFVLAKIKYRKSE